MKCKVSGRVPYILAVTLVILFSTAARPQKAYANSVRFHHYALIDLGTFGGPASYFNPGSGNATRNFAAVLNDAGKVAGYADTKFADPFPLFQLWDAFVPNRMRKKDRFSFDYHLE